mmetsp:Transcript_45024/g.105176  ORF Transcript_45024/g.105176 Transcript_45024/m.105176 type:complete len:374 (-) Transcript_45024:818-1939(-)
MRCGGHIIWWSNAFKPWTGSQLLWVVDYLHAIENSNVELSRRPDLVRHEKSPAVEVDRKRDRVVQRVLVCDSTTVGVAREHEVVIKERRHSLPLQTKPRCLLLDRLTGCVCTDVCIENRYGHRRHACSAVGTTIRCRAAHRHSNVSCDRGARSPGDVRDGPFAGCTDQGAYLDASSLPECFRQLGGLPQVVVDEPSVRRKLEASSRGVVIVRPNMHAPSIDDVDTNKSWRTRAPSSWNHAVVIDEVERVHVASGRRQGSREVHPEDGQCADRRAGSSFEDINGDASVGIIRDGDVVLLLPKELGRRIRSPALHAGLHPRWLALVLFAPGILTDVCRVSTVVLSRPDHCGGPICLCNEFEQLRVGDDVDARLID